MSSMALGLTNIPVQGAGLRGRYAPPPADGLYSQWNVCLVDVPSLVLDLLLTTRPHHESSVSTSTVDLLLTRCVHLLRALAHQNDLIQTRILDHFFVLLDVDAVHSDIALLVRDVSYISHSSLLIDDVSSDFVEPLELHCGHVGAQNTLHTYQTVYTVQHLVEKFNAKGGGGHCPLHPARTDAMSCCSYCTIFLNTLLSCTILYYFSNLYIEILFRVDCESNLLCDLSFQRKLAVGLSPVSLSFTLATSL